MYFGSDNQTGASKQVLATLQQANEGFSDAYGADEWTQQAIAMLQQCFNCDADIFLVSTGTAANALALSCLVQPWDSILCHGQAHIINDELTAPELFTGGARLIGLAAKQAKLPAAAVADFLAQTPLHAPHKSVARALSLTQASEAGQVYQLEEIRALTDIAHQHGLHVHMDGARFANAIAAVDCSPAAMTWQAGIDVLSLGATKNGALAAEAVIFFNKALAKDFVARRKRAGHLISKGRLLGAQMVGWLKNNHWLTLAAHANQMAAKIDQALAAHPDYQVIWPVPANELFVLMSKQNIARLRAEGAVFYEWPAAFLPAELAADKEHDVVRLVTSFQTEPQDVERFIAAL